LYHSINFLLNAVNGNADGGVRYAKSAVGFEGASTQPDNLWQGCSYGTARGKANDGSCGIERETGAESDRLADCQRNDSGIDDNSGMESIKKVFENKKIVVILREVQQIKLLQYE